MWLSDHDWHKLRPASHSVKQRKEKVSLRIRPGCLAQFVEEPLSVCHILGPALSVRSVVLEQLGRDLPGTCLGPAWETCPLSITAAAF